MQAPQYALVAYIRNSLGEFVENLRRELHPPHAHLPAHITVLPPRILLGPEEQALEQVRGVCAEANPFEIALGEVETFMPVTPTIFVRVAHSAYRMRELHDRLNVGALACDENWPYMPHLTIAKLDRIEDAQHALEVAAERWKAFPQPRRRVQIDELTFVRQGKASNEWIDLAPFHLGRGIALAR